MKIYKLNLSLKECLDKEWIVTNGIGGYSSSTICFANTRRYHGLLVAPTKKNGIRRVFLSKIDEALIIGEDKEEHILYTNISNEYISNGYRDIERVEKDIFPKVCYKIDNKNKDNNNNNQSKSSFKKQEFEDTVYLEKEVFMENRKKYCMYNIYCYNIK